MSGLVHSINISSGGVPKRTVDSAKIGKKGVEGDFNRFRDGQGGISIERSASSLSSGSRN